MKNVDRTPIEDEEESEFPGCLIVGILVAVLGSLFIIISALTRIKDIVIRSKPVEFIKAAVQKQRLQKRTHKEENIKK
jgi:hypothetical protein